MKINKNRNRENIYSKPSFEYKVEFHTHTCFQNFKHHLMHHFMHHKFQFEYKKEVPIHFLKTDMKWGPCFIAVRFLLFVEGLAA